MQNTLTVLLVLLCTNFILSAQDCISGWAFYRSVTINNSNGGDLSDYQVKVQLNTAELLNAGHFNSGGTDLRVFDASCSPLPFWGDSLGNSTTTDLWVKLPNLAAGASTTLQVYYGNPSAGSALDGDNTFLFFDDFSSNTVDLSKWEAVGEFASLEVVDGILNYASTGSSQASRFKFLRSAAAFTEEVTIDYNGSVSNSNGFGYSSGDVTLERILFRQSGFGFDTLNQIAYMQDTVSNGFQVEGLYPLLRFDRGEFNTASVTLGINDTDNLAFSRFANVGLGDENTNPYVFSSTPMTSFHFILSSFNQGVPIQLDNIRVRQAVVNPPLATVGPELVSDPTRVTTLIDPALVQVFPNPSSEYSIIQIDWPEGVRLELQDASGRILPQASVTLAAGQSHRLELTNLARGMYFVTFRDLKAGSLLHTRALSVQ